MKRNKKVVLGIGGFIVFMLQLWKFRAWWGQMAQNWFPWNLLVVAVVMSAMLGVKLYKTAYLPATDEEKEDIRKWLQILVKIIAAIILGVIVFSAIFDTTEQKPEVKKAEKAVANAKKTQSVDAPVPPLTSPTVTDTGSKPVSKPKTFGAWVIQVISFFLLIGVSVLVCLQVLQESKKPESTQRAGPQQTMIESLGVDWKKFLSHPTVYAAVAVLTINVFLMFSLTNLWIAFLGNFGFFILVNIGTIIATHFFKKGGVAKVVGFGIVLIVIATAFETFSDGINFSGWNNDSSKRSAFGSPDRSDPMVASRYDGIPAEVALPQICGCESSGVAGRIWHYKNNDPDQGINTSETNDVGACQINVPLHEKVAYKKYGLKIHTQEGNMAYAKILYQDHGVKPWVGKPGKTTIRCWGPILAKLQEAGEYEVKLVAPVKEFGPERDVSGYEFSWGRSPGAFVVRNDQGLEAKFDPAKNIRENLPYITKGEKRGYSKTIQFKSLSDKPQEVVLELKRQ